MKVSVQRKHFFFLRRKSHSWLSHRAEEMLSMLCNAGPASNKWDTQMCTGRESINPTFSEMSSQTILTTSNFLVL